QDQRNPDMTGTADHGQIRGLGGGDIRLRQTGVGDIQTGLRRSIAATCRLPFLQRSGAMRTPASTPQPNSFFDPSARVTPTTRSPAAPLCLTPTTASARAHIAGMDWH